MCRAAAAVAALCAAASSGDEEADHAKIVREYLEERKQEEAEAQERIRVTYGKAYDEFRFIPRTSQNELLALEEEPKWLGKMSRFRRQSPSTRMFLRCDICWQLRDILHYALDGLKLLHRAKLQTELIDKHFSHGVQNFCINMTDQHSLLLHHDRFALPKFVRRGGEDTVKSGWPEAYFFMTCEDMMHALPPHYLLQTANARADESLRWGPDGALDICETRYQCSQSTDQERKRWAEDMKQKDFPAAWSPPGHPKPYEEKHFELTEEQKERLLYIKEHGLSPGDGDKSQSGREKGARKPGEPRADGMPEPKFPKFRRAPVDPIVRKGGRRLTPEQSAAHAKAKMHKMAEAWSQGKESVEEMNDIEAAATALFERRKQLQEQALRLRRLREKAREEAARHGEDEDMDVEARMRAAADAAAGGAGGAAGAGGEL